MTTTVPAQRSTPLNFLHHSGDASQQASTLSSTSGDRGTAPCWRVPKKHRNRNDSEMHERDVFSVSHGVAMPINTSTSLKLVDSAKRHLRQEGAREDPWKPGQHMSPPPKPTKQKLFGRGRVEGPSSGETRMELPKGRRKIVPRNEVEGEHVSFHLPPLSCKQ